MAEESTALALALPETGQLRDQLRAVAAFQAVVHAELKEGHDYGVIPGTSKPTLLKPGAEKIAKLLGLADEYDILDQREDWDKPFFRYLIRCRLVSLAHGVTVSQGLGECNSMEAKYRWREGRRRCPSCGSEAIIKGKEEYGGGWICYGRQGGCGAKYSDGDPAIVDQRVGRVENDDIYSSVNTIIKMSKKRALVDASLSAGRLSEIFTQDLEDIAGPPDAPASRGEARRAASPAPKSPARPQPTNKMGHKEFWPAAIKELGFSGPDAVTEALGLSHPNDIAKMGYEVALQNLRNIKASPAPADVLDQVAQHVAEVESQEG